MKILVTGGAGFIGSALCRYLAGNNSADLLNVDKLTYAANLALARAPIAKHARYAFLRADICDRAAMDAAFAGFKPDAVIHLAAESHVDRSITGSSAFIETNINGTYTLLEAARAYWLGLAGAAPGRLPLPARLDGRGLRLARRRRALRGGDALRSKLALFGEQGGVRSSRPRLAPHLRLSGADLQLLEQLRAVSVPGEAHSADDPQRSRRQAAARLRRRPQRARLALRRRSRAGAVPDPAARPAG